MTFKEKLKENCYCHSHHVCHWCYIAIYSDELEEMFLDKQKVKEVIEDLSWSGVSQTYNEIYPQELLKKLGLE